MSVKTELLKKKKKIEATNKHLLLLEVNLKSMCKTKAKH